MKSFRQAHIKVIRSKRWPHGQEVESMTGCSYRHRKRIKVFLWRENSACMHACMHEKKKMGFLHTQNKKKEKKRKGTRIGWRQQRNSCSSKCLVIRAIIKYKRFILSCGSTLHHAVSVLDMPRLEDAKLLLVQLLTIRISPLNHCLNMVLIGCVVNISFPIDLYLGILKILSECHQLFLMMFSLEVKGKHKFQLLFLLLLILNFVWWFMDLYSVSLWEIFSKSTSLEKWEDTNHHTSW